MTTSIKRGHTILEIEDLAISEIASQLDAKNSDTNILFISSWYDLSEIKKSIKKYFKNNVIACTTSGEIGKLSLTSHGISGLSFKNRDIAVKAAFVKDIDIKTEEEINKELESHYLESVIPKKLKLADNKFGLLLTDGLSLSEEKVVESIIKIFPDLVLVGGSAGDDYAFKNTFIFFDGEFHLNSAVFLLCGTNLPIFPFKIHNFLPSEKKLVVTRGDHDKRTIYEINNKPAAYELARLLRISHKDLVDGKYLQHPLIHTDNYTDEEKYFIRSIRRIEPDDSIILYSGIKDGEVLKIANHIDYIESLKASFNSIEKCMPNPEVFICFECILRKNEIIESGLENVVSEIFGRLPTVGFHTYGEQFGDKHMNQTLTGIALGSK